MKFCDYLLAFDEFLDLVLDVGEEFGRLLRRERVLVFEVEGRFVNLFTAPRSPA